MSDTPFDDDTELRGLAMAAFHEHEQTVSPAETDAALVAVRSRIEAGDLGGSSPVLFTEEPARRGGSPWLLAAAAATVIAMVGAGLVAVVGNGNGGTADTASTAPEAQTPSTAELAIPPATTTADVAASTTTSPTSTLPTATTRTIAVDAADPPPLIDPTPFASIPLEPNPDSHPISVAMGDGRVIVQQPDRTIASSIDLASGEITDIDVGITLHQIVVGPGDVLYGFGPARYVEGTAVPNLPFVAVALSGERAGEIVAEVEYSANSYVELPAGVFGHGPDGIIDRLRNVNTTMLGYVDETGAAVDWPEAPPVITYDRFDTPSTISVEGGASWNLVVAPDPANGGSYLGPSPAAPTSDGRVVYSERIGVDLTPDEDFGPSAMPVVAILNPDGSGSWVRLPDDWDVVASDVWGTVLGRQVDGTLELALLDEALVPSDEPTVPAPTTEPDDASIDEPTGSADDEVLAIVNNCSVDSQCTLLAHTEDGRMVAYDPLRDAFLVYDESGQVMQAEVPVDESLALAQPFIEHVGPDDVAYVSIPTPGSLDPSRDLLAIPLTGQNAGAVVMRWTGLDGSGDSSLIPRKAGLVVVGCCGPRVPRPSPEAPIYRYVDRSGDIVESTAPTFRLDLGDAGSSLVRINEDGSSTFFSLPTALQYPRDFPRVVATADGGALASDFDQLTQRSFIVRFRTDWPEFGIDNADVYVFDDPFTFGPLVLEPSGTVIVSDGLRFIRRTPAEIATPGWPGTVEIGVQGGTVVAPGLNDYIATNQPSWADDPLLFAMQLKQFIGPNESVVSEFDEATGVLTVTTSGFLDDSVAAGRMTIQTERADDGLLRFLSGAYGEQCQPGRGHQDFSTELCL